MKLSDLPLNDRVLIFCGNPIVLEEKIKRLDPFQWALDIAPSIPKEES